MSDVSKSWKFNLENAVQGEIAAMLSGSFNLVAASAVMYIKQVYWSSPAYKADEVTATLHIMMDGLNYGKSSKYALTSAALSIARNWTKRFGAPNSVKERNVFWNTILDCVTYSEMMAFVVTAIQADYGDTMGKVYETLKAGKAAAPASVEKTLADKVKASLAKADVADASAAAVTAMAFLASEDKMAALTALIAGMSGQDLTKALTMVNDRMVAMNEEAAKQGVKSLEEQEAQRKVA